MAKEKSKAQKELDEYRETKIAYLSKADKDMDFSKADSPEQKPMPQQSQKTKK